MRAWSVWLLPLLTGIIFLILILFNWNQPLFLALNRIGPATSESLWAHITVLGDTLVALALCLPLWRRRPDLVWALLFAVVLSALWVHVLKQAADVPRPPAVLQGLHVIGPAYKAGAFPSGHATTAFTIAGLFALGFRSPVLTTVSLLVALAIGLSRMVVGVHWPLDVLAGVFGGWLCAAAGLRIGKRTENFGRKAWVQWILGLLLVACCLVLIYGNSKSGYLDTLNFQRAVGLAGLLFAGARLIRDFRRRPGL